MTRKTNTTITLLALLTLVGCEAPTPRGAPELSSTQFASGARCCDADSCQLPNVGEPQCGTTETIKHCDTWVATTNSGDTGRAQWVCEGEIR